MVVLSPYACPVCFYRVIWVCMWVWGWIWAVSAVACGLTVVNAAIFAQASLSRLGESIRVLTTTRARLGDLSTFWATPCLAQARRSRLSEKSWTTPRCPSRLSENSWRGYVTRLAWARMREGAMFPWLLSGSMHALFWFVPSKYDVREYAWVFGFLWMKLACLGWDWWWSCGFVMF